MHITTINKKTCEERVRTGIWEGLEGRNGIGP